MGQSQLLIIAISVLIVGIAILAGAGFFDSGETDSNKKAMINDINQIAGQAARYYRRPTQLAGGNYSYVGFLVPTKYQTNLNGTYSTTALNAKNLQIRGVSSRDTSNTITAQIDMYGKASNWIFTGDFE
jgi:hypothetical protein